MKVISDVCYRGHQSVVHKQTFTVTKADLTCTFRIHVNAETFKPQSFAKIEIWTQNGWQKVHTISGHEMDTYRSNPNDYDLAAERPFEQDVDELIRVAYAILFPS